METNSAQQDVNDDGSVLANFRVELRRTGCMCSRSGSEGETADLLLHRDT